MSSYYLRYTTDPEGDMKLGFSFVNYIMFSDYDEAVEEFENFGEDVSELVFEERSQKWGLPHNGLFGYRFETLEEAKAAIGSDNYADPGNRYATIYLGEYCENGRPLDNDGDMFTPISIVFKTLEY